MSNTGFTSLGESTLIKYDTFYNSIGIVEGASNYVRKASELVNSCLSSLDSRLKGSYSPSLSTLVSKTQTASNESMYLSNKLSQVHTGLKQLESESTVIDAQVETLIEEKMNSIYDSTMIDESGAFIVNSPETESIWTKIGNFFGGIFNFVTDVVKQALATLVNAFIAVVEGLLAFVESIVDCVIMLVGLIVKGGAWVLNQFGTDFDLDAIDRAFANVVACDVAGNIASGIYAAVPWIKENSWIADTWIEEGIVGVGKWGGIVLTGAAITYFTAGAGTVPFITAVMGSTGATVAVAAASGFGESSQDALQAGHSLEAAGGYGLLGAGTNAVEAYFISGGVKALVGSKAAIGTVGKNSYSYFIKDKTTGLYRAANSSQGKAVTNFINSRGFLDVSSTKMATGLLNLPTTIASTKVAQALGNSKVVQAGAKLTTALGGKLSSAGRAIAGTGLGKTAISLATSKLVTVPATAAAGILGAGVLGNVLEAPQTMISNISGASKAVTPGSDTTITQQKDPDEDDENSVTQEEDATQEEVFEQDPNAEEQQSGETPENVPSNSDISQTPDEGTSSNTGTGNSGGGNGSGGYQGSTGGGNVTPATPESTPDSSTTVENPEVTPEQGTPETENPETEVPEETPTDTPTDGTGVTDPSNSNATGWDRYQEALGEEISDMYENDPDALRAQLKEYGYTDQDVEKLMSDESLAKEAVYKAEQNERINQLLDIRENYTENPQVIEEQLKEYGYTDSEIDIIMKDEKLVNEAYTSAELEKDFGISEKTFDRVLEVNDMYYNNPEELRQLLKKYGYSDNKIDLIMKDREMAQNTILAYEERLSFSESLGNTEITTPTDPVAPSITQNADGSVTYSQGTLTPETGTLDELLRNVTGYDGTVQLPTDTPSSTPSDTPSGSGSSMNIDENGNITFQ